MRNTIALVAIAVIIVRAMTLLTQAQGEVFESRNTMEDCRSDWAEILMKDVKVLVVRMLSCDELVMALTSSSL